MRYFTRILIAALVCFQWMAQTANGQDDVVNPRLVICGGGSLPDNVYQRFLKLAGSEPKLVVIPTASQRDFDVAEVQKLWMSRGFQNVQVLHTKDREVASSADFVTPLKTSTAVWFGGGSQQRIADAYLGTLVEKELHSLLRRGGVIGGTSAGAAIQTQVMIAGGRREPEVSVGFNLLSGAIVDQHFLKRNRIHRLVGAIRAHPKLVGFGIDEGTAVVASDGKLEVVGRSYVMRVEFGQDGIQLDSFNSGEFITQP